MKRNKRASWLERAGNPKSVETLISQAILDNRRPSMLMTDGYKFSMAQAGFSLRRETFYLSFRREGCYFIPFDLEAVVREFLPDDLDYSSGSNENDFLARHGYMMSPAMKMALQEDIEIWAAPKGTWVREREPILTITGPSFLVSWLEPLMIALHFPIQIATEAMETGTAIHKCTCESEKMIILHTLEAIEFNNTCSITPERNLYINTVRKNAYALREIVGPDRIVEVGMRGATCLEMHTLAIQTCQLAGIDRTSNVWGARDQGMIPTGTTGHEHQQRWGNDLEAFRAIRDMRPQMPSYLFDTFDTMASGIPSAVVAMKERPDIPHAVRFDSGDQETQLRKFLDAERLYGIKPHYMFMDGINPDKALRFHTLCKSLGVPRERVSYGSGGFLVCDPAPTEFTRNRVSAVYKLSQTGDNPVMKFSVPSKMSLPGRPIIFRSEDGKRSLVGDMDDKVPLGYHPINPNDREKPESTDTTPAMSDRITLLWHKSHSPTEECIKVRVEMEKED